MTAKKTNVRVPRCRRNRCKRWTPKATASFTRDWGRLCARKLVDKYGRTESALYNYATTTLGLPPQSQGYVTVKSAARQLGMASNAVRFIAKECGIVPWLATPLSQHQTINKHRVVDMVEMEIIVRKRDVETVSPRPYGVTIGRSEAFVDHRLLARGLIVRDGSSKRIPLGLADEIVAGTEGPWCAVWRAVLAAGELPVARWFVALAVHDFVFGDVASREWFETVATKTSRDVVMPLVKQLRGPSVVRAERKSDVSRRRNRERAA